MIALQLFNWNVCHTIVPYVEFPTILLLARLTIESLRASVVYIAERSVIISCDFMPDVLQLSFCITFIHYSLLCLFLERNKLLSECYLLLSHLLLKLADFFFEVGLKRLADVLNDARLVDQRLRRKVFVWQHHVMRTWKAILGNGLLERRLWITI